MTCFCLCFTQITKWPCSVSFYGGLKATLSEAGFGAQGRPPQSVPQCHIDYFELKLLRKKPMQEGHIFFFIVPCATQ